MRYAIESMSPGAYDVTRKLLQNRGQTWSAMQRALFLTIPNTLSITMQPGATAEVMNAVVKDIVMRLNHMCKRVQDGKKWQIEPIEEQRKLTIKAAGLLAISASRQPTKQCVSTGEAVDDWADDDDVGNNSEATVHDREGDGTEINVVNHNDVTMMSVESESYSDV